MTIDEATATAKAAYEAANPHLDLPSQDFTVPPEVFDLIERHLVGVQGFAYVKDEGAIDHLLWYGVRMLRGPDGR